MRVYQKHFQLRSKEFDIDLNTYATICQRSFVHIYIVKVYFENWTKLHGRTVKASAICTLANKHSFDLN